MGITAQRVRDEVTEGDRAVYDSLSETYKRYIPPEVTWVGSWIGRKLSELGLDRRSVATYQFKCGRMCLGRDPYQAAADLYNQISAHFKEGEIKYNEAIYDEKIAPLMEQVIAICQEHNLPVFAAFQYGPEDMCITHIPVDGEDPSLIISYFAVINRGQAL